MMRWSLSPPVSFSLLFMSNWKYVVAEMCMCVVVDSPTDFSGKAAARSSKKLGSIHSVGGFYVALLTPSGEMPACLSEHVETEV